MLVLDVVGGGKVHQVWSPIRHQLASGSKHEFGELRRIDAGHLHADHLGHDLDPVFGKRRLIRLLRGETDSSTFPEAQPVSEQPTQLVLGGDNRNRSSGLLKRREEGGGAKQRGIVHHHLLPGFRVEEVVPGNSVNHRRASGDDGEVVGVGEARHHALGAQVHALRKHPLHEGHHPIGHRRFDVSRLRTVNADHHRRCLRPGVASSVDFNRFHAAFSAGAQLWTPMVSRVLPITATASSSTSGVICPMQPIRKVSATVNLPG